MCLKYPGAARDGREIGRTWRFVFCHCVREMESEEIEWGIDGNDGGVACAARGASRALLDSIYDFTILDEVINTLRNRKSIPFVAPSILSIQSPHCTH